MFQQGRAIQNIHIANGQGIAPDLPQADRRQANRIGASRRAGGKHPAGSIIKVRLNEQSRLPKRCSVKPVKKPDSLESCEVLRPGTNSSKTSTLPEAPFARLGWIGVPVARAKGE